MDFKRNFNEIHELTRESSSVNLFSNYLKPDCEKQKVFMTIRNGYLDFYHKGGRLFKFDKNGFQTHIKYAAVIEKDKTDYLTQRELEKYKLSIKFDKSYERIKENCANYSGIEALGVSYLYHTYSYLSKNDIIVLDIEVSFKSNDENKKQDRIDILLFNQKTKTLKFVEAKHYSNSEIKSKSKPKVVDQIKQYKEQISKINTQILKAYENYINIVNKLFEINLSIPEKICDEVTLLIFGFDNDQKKGGLKKIKANLGENKIKTYTIGDIKNIKVEQLWGEGCNEI